MKSVRANRAIMLLAVALLLLAPATALAQQSAREIYLQGREHLIEERYDRALEQFRKVVADFGESEEADDAQFYIGYTLQRLGRYQEAIEAFEALLNRWPDSVRAESARARQLELMGRTGGTGDAAVLAGILRGGVSWEARRDMALALARAGDFSGADILEEVMRRESSSRKLLLIRILGRHTSNPVARRILTMGLEPSNAGSVQLQTLAALRELADRPEITTAIVPVLEGSYSTSVQMKALQALMPYVQRPNVRTAIAGALSPGNSSSVKIMACSALNGRMLAPEVKPAIVRLFRRSESSSVQLEALKGVEADRDDPGVVEILEAAVGDRNSSSVQLKAMRIARASRNPRVRAVGRIGLLPGNSSSVQLEAVKVFMEGRDEPAAAAALEEVFRQRGTSTSVQLAALDALAQHMATPAAPLALALALRPDNSTSVQLKAMELGGRYIAQREVKQAVLRLLEQSGTSTSVQLKAIKVLAPQTSNPEVRRIIAASLRPQNSTSTQLKAIEALESRVAEADVRVALAGTLARRYSTSVVLSSMKSLEPWVDRDRNVKRAFLKVMEDERISSTARIRAAEALLPGADARQKARIADAMEDVIITIGRQRFRNWSRDTMRDALDLIERIDPERARELERRYWKPPSLLERIFRPPLRTVPRR